jgi:hypothetical protein
MRHFLVLKCQIFCGLQRACRICRTVALGLGVCSLTQIFPRNLLPVKLPNKFYYVSTGYQNNYCGKEVK